MTTFEPYQIAVPHQMPPFLIEDPDHFIGLDSPEHNDLHALHRVEDAKDETALLASCCLWRQDRPHRASRIAALATLAIASRFGELTEGDEAMLDAIVKIATLTPLDEEAVEAIKQTIEAGENSASALIPPDEEWEGGAPSDAEEFIAARADDREWSLDAWDWCKDLDEKVRGDVWEACIDLAQAAEARYARDNWDA